MKFVSVARKKIHKKRKKPGRIRKNNVEYQYIEKNNKCPKINTKNEFLGYLGSKIKKIALKKQVGTLVANINLRNRNPMPKNEKRNVKGEAACIS